MRLIEIIPDNSGVTDFPAIHLHRNEALQIGVDAGLLQAGEVVSILMKKPNGEGCPLIMNGAAVALSSEQTSITIEGPAAIIISSAAVNAGVFGSANVDRLAGEITGRRFAWESQ